MAIVLNLRSNGRLLAFFAALTCAASDLSAQSPNSAPTLGNNLVQAQRINNAPRAPIPPNIAFFPARPSFGDAYSRPFVENTGDRENVSDAGERPCDEQRGNPVLLTTGNKIETHIDFESNGEMPLSLVRTYNRFWTYDGLLGSNWLTSYDYSLTPPVGTSNAWINLPDGRRVRFVWSVAQQRWNEDKPQPVAWLEKLANLSFVHHNETGGTEQYNRYGYVTRVLNRHGVGWTYSYSYFTGPLDRFITITHSSGRLIRFVYNMNASLINVIAPDGQIFRFDVQRNVYGPWRDRLVSVTTPGPNPTITQYHYEDTNQPDALTGVSYNNQRFSTFAYDALGRATLSKHLPNVEQSTFTYTATVNPPPPNPPADPPAPVCNPDTGECPPPPIMDAATSRAMAERQARYEESRATLRQPRSISRVVETNALGRVTEHDINTTWGRIDQSNNLPSANCPSSVAKRFYDAAGFLDYTLDFNNNRTEHSYSPAGQMLSVVEAAGTAVARTRNYTWTARNLPETVSVPNQVLTTYSYRPDERIDGVAVRNLSSIGVTNEERVTDYDYTLHPNGLVATMTADGPIPGASDVITSTFASTGDLLTVSNSLGHTVTYSNYNPRGQAGRVVGVNGEQTDYGYDTRGRLTTVTTNRNGQPRITTWAYTAADLLGSITYPDGVVESYTYDAARRLTSTTRVEVDGSFKRELVYDAASNIIEEKGFLGPDLVFQKFTEYDEQNRVRERRGNPTNAFATQFLLTYKYDLNSNLTEVQPVIGPATIYEYDALDRIKKMTDPASGISFFAYDSLDQPTQVTDPRGKVTSYQTDGFGQTWTQVSPDTGTTTHSWNAAGQRIGSIRADGVSLSYLYDGLGRPTSATAGTETRTTTWDTGANCSNGLGRICALTDPYQTLRLSYLREGELTAQRATIGADTYIQTFDYDPIGRLTGIGYPGNVRVDYQWAAGRQTGMTATINGVTQTVVSNAARRYITDGGANILGDLFNYGNGKLRADGFDRDGRHRGRFTDGKQAFDLFRDANGRITKFLNYTDPQQTQDFGYDPLNRLTSALSSGYGTQAFGYDANSNRISHTRSANAPQIFAINSANNRINTVSGFTRTYSYKPTGQILAITGGAVDLISESRFETPLRNLNFSYDSFNRLSGVTGQNLTATYKIAATNMRVEKTANGRTTRFVYGLDARLLYERDLTASRDSQHLYFQGEPVGMVRNNTLYFVLPDHLGRPELLMANAPAGNAVWRIALTAFERAQTLTDTIGGYNLGFPGQYHDEETGFAYNINRDYDPATGRYLQSDPIGLTGGLDTYGYVGGNPINSTDPSGLDVMVCLYSGAAGFGHVGIGVNSEATSGFYPGGLRMISGTSGVVKPDDPKKKQECKAISTTPAQDQRLENLLLASSSIPSDYTLTRNNCVNFVRWRLREIGIQSDNSIYPRDFFNTLEASRPPFIFRGGFD